MTGLDPSPLQDFSLLIRSLLVSDAPGSRTFKPCPERVVHFSELKKKLSWTIKALWQTAEGPLQGAALPQSAEKKKKKTIFRRALKN